MMHEPTGDSRRSFMAKSALATGALTLGTATIGAGTATAQDGQVAVFASKYYPGADFDVLSQLQASTTVSMLQIGDETAAEISQPDEYNGYIIRYNIGAESGGITTFLFARNQSLSEGDSGTIGESASVLTSDLNLLNTSLDGGGGADGGDTTDEEESADGNETTDEEPPADENETAGGNESDGGA